MTPTDNTAGGADDQTLKTGTTVVGVTATDGVVVAADRRASLGSAVVAHKQVQKIEQIHPHAVLTLVGDVGGAQALVENLRAEVSLYETRRGTEMSIPALSTIAANFLRGGGFSIVAPVLAGVDDEGQYVYSLDPAGSVLRDDYTASGSGLPFALGLLESEYREDLTTDEAAVVAAKAVRSAVERDTASGNGVTVAVLTDEGVTINTYERFDDLLGSDDQD